MKKLRNTKMTTYKTEKQLEIERLDEKEEYNYRIVWGNPLTGEKDKEIFANMLKINDYGMATSYIELGEYNKEIKIEVNNSLVNIVLE